VKLLAIFGARNNGYHKFQLQIDIENLFVFPSSLLTFAWVSFPASWIFLQSVTTNAAIRGKYAQRTLAEASINFPLSTR